MILETPAILFFAFLLDLLFGDPVYAFHPVRLIGRAVALFEGRLRAWGWSGRGGGILLVISVLGLVAVAYLILFFSAIRLHPWCLVFLNLFFCYTCLAFKDLCRHLLPVIQALEGGDLASARLALAKTVGREVNVLDAWGIGRAGVETLAENFVDGFLAPVFWLVVGAWLGGLIGISASGSAVLCMLFFKTASTLDSMVGYKNDQYYYFGWAGARLDDLMNFIPARLSIFFLYLGALPARLHAGRGVRIAWRDRLKHASPNAGHAESFAAGALGVRLGGPTRYADGLEEKPWLGDGTIEVAPIHIRQTLRLLHYTAWLVMACGLSVLFLLAS